MEKTKQLKMIYQNFRIGQQIKFLYAWHWEYGTIDKIHNEILTVDGYNGETWYLNILTENIEIIL